MKDFVLTDNLAVCAAGRAIDVINLETHQLVSHFETRVKVASIALSEARGIFVAGLENGSVLVGQLGKDGTISVSSAIQDAHSDYVGLCAACEDKVLTCDVNGELGVWQLK